MAPPPVAESRGRCHRHAAVADTLGIDLRKRHERIECGPPLGNDVVDDQAVIGPGAVGQRASAVSEQVDRGGGDAVLTREHAGLPLAAAVAHVPATAIAKEYERHRIRGGFRDPEDAGDEPGRAFDLEVALNYAVGDDGLSAPAYRDQS